MSDHTQSRSVITITGEDRVRFLQDLVTNDVSDLGDGLVYAALLNPQGKYLFDFFLFATGEAILIDIQADQAAAFSARLNLYKLRADVVIAPSDLRVSCGVGTMPDGAMADPRHDSLGWRFYGDNALELPQTDWDALRVSACVPATGVELIADSSYILECGFERLHGVDFAKGCYVGQEVTARMKHKTELRKGLGVVTVTGSAEPGTPIENEGLAVGTLMTVAGEKAIAHLRFEKSGMGMTAGAATVDWKA